MSENALSRTFSRSSAQARGGDRPRRRSRSRDVPALLTLIARRVAPSAARVLSWVACAQCRDRLAANACASRWGLRHPLRTRSLLGGREKRRRGAPTNHGSNDGLTRGSPELFALPEREGTARRVGGGEAVVSEPTMRRPCDPRSSSTNPAARDPFRRGPIASLLFADDALTIGSGGEASRRTSSATSWKERLVRLDPWK